MKFGEQSNEEIKQTEQPKTNRKLKIENTIKKYNNEKQIIKLETQKTSFKRDKSGQQKLKKSREVKKGNLKLKNQKPTRN